MTDIRWISENSSVAQIDQKERVTGCHSGTVLITGITINGISTQVKVIVQEEETT